MACIKAPGPAAKRPPHIFWPFPDGLPIWSLMTSSIFSLGNAIRAVLFVGLFGVLFVLVQSCQRPATGIDIYAKDTLKKLTVRENPPLPPTGSYGIPGNLQLRGYPTTLIYNPQGREIAILEGEADWDSPEALSLVDYLLTK